MSMTFLDFIRRVHEERKARGFVIKGGKGSGWYAPPKGTHGKGAKSKDIERAIDRFIPESNRRNLRLKKGQGLWEGKDNTNTKLGMFMYNPTTKTLLAGATMHFLLHYQYAGEQQYDDFVKMIFDGDGNLRTYLDRVRAKDSTEAWNKCFDAVKVMRAVGFPDNTKVAICMADQKQISELKLGEI